MEHARTDFIYLPPRATAVTVREVQRRMNAPYRLNFGIAEIDARLVPPIPGELVGLLGRPGHAKTTTKIALARRWSKILRKYPDPNNRIPLLVYATWETTVEEFMAVYTAGESKQSLEDIGRGTADVKRIEQALVNSLANNVVVIGRSNEQYMTEGGDQAPLPTLDDLEACVAKLREDGYTIGALFVDYLQRIPHPKYRGGNDRSSRVNENVDMLKDIAMRYRLPVVMGVQADRRVDAYAGLKFPTMQDGQWTSGIEQTADKLWSVTVPSKYMDIGQEIELGQWRYAVTPQTLALRSLKQRFAPHDESDAWLLDIDFSQAEMHDHPVAGEAGKDAPFA